MSNPLSPRAMLATSMQVRPGVYALLLGSGLSTGAGVPTGWGVVTELVRRVAAVEDPSSVEGAASDPEKWRHDHGEPLGYSSLLEALAPTPAARQGLLADFFEPSDEEREQGIKTPSRGHLAIAELVKRGSVKVIITTNFDATRIRRRRRPRRRSPRGPACGEPPAHRLPGRLGRQIPPAPRGPLLTHHPDHVWLSSAIASSGTSSARSSNGLSLSATPRAHLLLRPGGQGGLARSLMTVAVEGWRPCLATYSAISRFFSASMCRARVENS